ncbi:hypothetical protein EUA72_01910, partial [TM7 phylum sp. oral taxon 352]
MNLDIVHIFTPSQIGLLGVKAAKKNNIPLIIQHCTDLYEFVDHYPAVLPGVLALAGVVFPLSVKLNGQDLLEVAKLYRPRSGVTKWNKDIIERVITAEFDDFWAVNCYTPNSKGDSSRLDLRYKKWDKAVLAYLEELELSKPVLYCGDMNVAYQEIDLANPKPNVGKHGFTDEEREGFQNYLDAGFTD